jgi:hypothetical protein
LTQIKESSAGRFYYGFCPVKFHPTQERRGSAAEVSFPGADMPRSTGGSPARCYTPICAFEFVRSVT